MDAEFSYNPMQDADFTDELDRRITEFIDITENRIYRRINTTFNQAVNYQDVASIAEEVINSRDIEGTVRGVVMNVLREIGLVDDNYRSHEPQDVDASEFDRIVI